MAVVASTKRRWLERTSGDEIPLAGDAPAWAASLLIHVVVLLALALIGTGNLEPRPRAITIVAPVAPVEDDVLVAPEMVIAPEQASAAATRISAASARHRPPPIAAPLTAAMIG